MHSLQRDIASYPKNHRYNMRLCEFSWNFQLPSGLLRTGESNSRRGLGNLESVIRYVYPHPNTLTSPTPLCMLKCRKIFLIFYNVYQCFSICIHKKSCNSSHFNHQDRRFQGPKMLHCLLQVGRDHDHYPIRPIDNFTNLTSEEQLLL